MNPAGRRIRMRWPKQTMPTYSTNAQQTPTLESTGADEFKDLILRSGQVAVCIIDSEGRYVTLSRRGAEVTGYTVSELLGRPSTFLVVPEDQLRIRKLIEKVLNSGESFPQMETTIVCKDGTQKIIRFDIGPVRDGTKIVGA